MQKYQSKILQDAIRLPAINWNLSFFGGHFQHVNAGWHVGIEQHLAFEVIQILSGQERVNLHRKSYLLTAGDILIIPPNLAHDITCVEEMDYFNFHFDLDDADFIRLLIENGLIYYPNAAQQNMALQPSLQVLNQLVDPAMDYSFESKLLIQRYLTDFLLALIHQTNTHSSAYNLNQLSYASSIASEVKEQLELQIHVYLTEGIDPREVGRLTIEQIISTLQISPSYGFELFKSVYGESPRAYLSKLKLQKAQQLLLMPKLSIGEISTALGYQEASHFSRQFKRWCGQTPMQYRQTAKKHSQEQAK